MVSISALVGGAILMLLTGLSTLAPKLCENTMFPNPEGGEEEVAESRIINGQFAVAGQIPYQVYIEIVKSWYSSNEICGGSILNHHYVITAAHCVYEIKKSNIKIRAGSIYRNKGGTTHNVAVSIIHGEFNKKTLRNDIALIKVQPPFQFSRNLGSVMALPPANVFPAPNSRAVVSGWGKFENSFKPPPTILRHTTVFIPDWEDCRRTLERHKFGLYTTNICTYVPPQETNYRGTCPGDSGGPVTVDGVLVGIVSWAKISDACGTEIPQVVTRVSAHIEWIRRNMV